MKLRDMRCKKCGGEPVQMGEQWLDKECEYDGDIPSHTISAFICAQGHYTGITLREWECKTCCAEPTELEGSAKIAQDSDATT